MPTVAEQLRAAREAKQITIQQLAEMTKIRTDHLRALEEGNYDVFSAPIYIRGSVKNCAMTLKLEVPKIMADLDKELKGTANFVANRLRSSKNPGRRGGPRHVFAFQAELEIWRDGGGGGRDCFSFRAGPFAFPSFLQPRGKVPHFVGWRFINRRIQAYETLPVKR